MRDVEPPPAVRHLFAVAARGFTVYDDIAGVASLTRYAYDVRDAVNKVRALATADLVYLRGYSLNQIAHGIGELTGEAPTHSSVREWLTRYGPTRYATVGHASGRYTLTWVPVMSNTQTRRELAAAVAAGRRVAPALWETGDNDSPTELWHRIADNI